MNSQPLVSAIIIFHNAEKFISEALASVFAQTFTDWELLLVDDGSTDSSSQIARCCAAQYPERVRYLEHEFHVNRGMSAARNLGFKHSRGEFIAYLDADDVWLPQAVEEQVMMLCANPEAAMVYGAISFWYSWTDKPEDYCRDFIYPICVPANRLIKPLSLVTLHLRGDAPFPVHGASLVRRESIRRIGGYEESFQGLFEDQVFYAKMCLNATVMASDQEWCQYRQHPDSCCAKGAQTGEYYGARKKYLGWMAEYLSAQGIQDAALWDALQHELWWYREPLVHTFLKRYPQWYLLLWRIRRLLRRMKGHFFEETKRVLLRRLRYWSGWWREAMVRSLR